MHGVVAVRIRANHVDLLDNTFVLRGLLVVVVYINYKPNLQPRRPFWSPGPESNETSSMSNTCQHKRKELSRKILIECTIRSSSPSG